MSQEDQTFDEAIEEMLAGLKPVQPDDGVGRTNKAGMSSETYDSFTDGVPETCESFPAEAPVINVINTILMYAIKNQVDELVVEPTKKGIGVHYEVNGATTEQMRLPPYVLAPLVKRLKEMGDMDTSECRASQEANTRFKMAQEDGGKDYDLLMRTSSTQWGERVTIRITPRTEG